MNLLFKTLVVCLLMLSLSGFSGKPAPVDIMPEADSCATCRMSVDNLSLASELILADGDVKKFDEIGCMVNYFKAGKLDKTKVRALFAKDFWTKKWLPMESAILLKSRFHTPMGYGILAFDSVASSKRLDPKYDGKAVRWDDLVKGR